jgi:hypothetical protein
MEIPIKVNLPDQQVVDPLGQKLINMTVSDIGVRQRPGCKDYQDLGTGKPITGIYDWREQRCIITVSDHKVFKLTEQVSGGLLLEDGSRIILEDGSGYLALEEGAPNTELTGDGVVYNDNRAIFANYGDYLYIASGNQIVELHPRQSIVSHNAVNYAAKINNIAIEPGVTAGWEAYWETTVSSGPAWNVNVRYGSGKADVLESLNAPTSVKWIATADKYLLALEDNTQRMWYSVIGKPWEWDSDWVSAEFLPDKASCMLVWNGDIFIGGLDTIQQFSNDGVTPWIPSGYGAITSGILAPYSFVSPGNGSLIYIDTQRRLVQMSNRTAKSLNTSLDSYLGDLSNISDAIGDYVTLEGVQYYIMQLPSERKTVALNLDNNSWSEWLYSPPGYKLKWNGNCITMVQPYGKVLIGDSIDGKVKELSTKFSKDAGDIDIVSTIRAPRNLTEDRIRSTELIVGFKQVSELEFIGESSLRVRWRDDGRVWSDYRVLDGINDETDYVGHLRRCGSYKMTRQYEFDCTHLHPYALQMVRQND